MKKIYFGWYIVAATLVFSIYNSTLFAYGFTAFVNPMAELYGWSFAQISLASSIRGLETGILDPFIGMASDRWSARKLVFIGIIISALGIIVFGMATNLAVLYAGFMLSGVGAALGISLVPITVISRWFKNNIGKANGILAAGVGAGGLFAVLVVKGIDSFGLQRFIIYLAIGLLVIGLPLSLVFRQKPEDYGLVADGKRPDGESHISAASFGLTLRQALKTRTFWFIGISQLFQMIAIHSVAVHQIPYLTSLGLERASAALAVAIFSGVGIGARLIYGFLADIFPKKMILATSAAITTGGLIIFQLLDGTSFVFVAVFAVIYGIGAGGGMSLRAPIIREYFGTKNFGSIFGVTALMVTIGGVLGAPITGRVFDVRGTYEPIWFIYAGLTTVGTILILMLPRSSSLKRVIPGPAA